MHRRNVPRVWCGWPVLNRVFTFDLSPGHHLVINAVLLFVGCICESGIISMIWIPLPHAILVVCFVCQWHAAKLIHMVDLLHSPYFSLLPCAIRMNVSKSICYNLTFYAATQFATLNDHLITSMRIMTHYCTDYSSSHDDNKSLRLIITSTPTRTNRCNHIVAHSHTTGAVSGWGKSQLTNGGGRLLFFGFFRPRDYQNRV